MSGAISLRHHLPKAIRALLLSLAFIPILRDPNTLFPFIFVKTLYLRIIVGAVWALLAVWLFKEKPSKEDIKKEIRLDFLKSKLFWAVLIFTTLALFSTLFSPNIYRSFFGTIERGEGYINLFFLLLLLTQVLMFLESRSGSAL